MKSALSETSFWIDSAVAHAAAQPWSSRLVPPIMNIHRLKWSSITSVRRYFTVLQRPLIVHARDHFFAIILLVVACTFCHPSVPTRQFVWELDVKSTCRCTGVSHFFYGWANDPSSPDNIETIQGFGFPRKSVWLMNWAHIYSSIALFSSTTWHGACLYAKQRGGDQVSDGKEDRCLRSNYFSDGIWFMMRTH